jgi:hypothetical protein
MKSNEEKVLELIKFALECNNDTLAIRHIEQYGFFKQGGYKEETKEQLNMHDVVGRSEQFYCKDESYHKIARCNKQCSDCLDFVNDLQ